MSKLTAKFDDRDSADLALMRLRRHGIDFKVEKLDFQAKHADTDFPGSMVNVVYPYGIGSAEPVGSSHISSLPNVGARALFSRNELPTSHATLHLDVRGTQLGRAQEIIRLAGGRNVTPNV